MFRFFLSCFIILNTIGQVNAQLYFNKIIQNNSKNPPFAQNLLYWNDDLILSYGFVDEDDGDKEKTSLILLDNNFMTKINEVIIDSVDGGFKSTALLNNKLFVFGNSVRPNANRFIYLRTLNVEYQIDQSFKFESLQYPSFVLYGQSHSKNLFIVSNEDFATSILKLNLNGQLQFYRLYKDELDRNSPKDFIVLRDENLLISSGITYFNKIGRYGQLQKIDTSGNVVWTYRSAKESRSGGSPFFAAELSNGNIVQVTEVDRFDVTNQYWEYPPLLRWVSKDGNFIKDTVILTSPRQRQALINGIKKGNGDYFFLRGNFYTADGGWAWITKINNDGDILWSHTYRHPEYRTKDAYYYLADMIEEENGDLTVYGSIDDFRTNPLKIKLWLFRVNKNGCYGGEACSEEEVLYTSVNDELSNENEIDIYPNPTEHKIIISFDETKTGECAIFDLTGNKVCNLKLNGQQKMEVDVSYFAKGTYFVKMKSANSGEVLMGKFVKM